MWSAEADGAAAPSSATRFGSDGPAELHRRPDAPRRPHSVTGSEAQRSALATKAETTNARPTIQFARAAEMAYLRF